jgi:general secretion pathway protein G
VRADRSSRRSGAHRAGPRAAAHGFTLLELLVVLAVLGLIAAIVSPQVMTMLSGAKSNSARLQVETIGTALNYYQLDVGAYPTTEQGLNALITPPKDARNWRGPYIRKRQHLMDPWNRAFLYRSPGRKGAFDLYSLGADGKEGGSGDDADVGNWEAN